MNINTWTVLLAATLTAVATGAGVLPFLFVKEIRRWWLSVFTALAAGLMLGASYSLINEGAALSFGRTWSGVLLGLGMIVAANKLEGTRDLLERER